MSYGYDVDEDHGACPFEDVITPVSWLCSLIDVSAGMKKNGMKVVYQDDKVVRVLVKDTGAVWEFSCIQTREPAR